MTTDFIIERAERYKLLTESSTDIIATVTPEGIYTYISSACIAIMGYEPDELTGTLGYNLIHPDDMILTGNLHTKMLADKEKTMVAFRVLHKAGHYIWLEATAQPILNPETGEIDELIVVSRDITERVESQHKIEVKIANMMEELELRVEERTKLLSLANGALSDEVYKREVVTSQMAQKNKEITDSIQYARRIQKAVLPKAENFYKLFPGSFILSKAKDIVSGDFLWFHETADKQIIALVDCSGHGVPASFMSIIGNELLNTIIINEGETCPSTILEKLEENLISSLRNGESPEDLKDGMDIGVCVIDKHTKQLTYSGAYRPLFIRNVAGELTEINGNPFSIGGGVNGRGKEFKKQVVEIEPGMTFYLSSDGYYSQFGGKLGKKFMKSRFRETLAEVCSLPIEQQKDTLTKTYTDWQGNHEQVDDVLVVGFRI